MYCMFRLASDNMAIWAVAGRVEKRKDELLRIAGEFARKNATAVQLIDSENVFGEDHLRAAFEKAVRAFRSEENVSSSLATEMMLYLSGRRQIQEALESIGLNEGSKAIVILSEKEPDELLRRLSFMEDDSVLSPVGKDVRRMGITDTEIATVKKDSVVELVLERVASVDVKKK